MSTRQRTTVSLVLAAAVLFAWPVGAAQDRDVNLDRPFDKTLVTDGHVVHDLGTLRNNVTNWGLIGSWPGLSTPFSASPSARWPGPDGLDHLYAAGLWVGGIVAGQVRVSTGQYNYEIMASEAPGDTIFPTFTGAVGGARFPWPGADDDSDGAEDEDPLDGVDNDGDGRIDEDYAAAGDQEFVCVMSDTTARGQSIFPDHVPLQIRVVQRSFQWADPALGHSIGYQFDVTNIGAEAIEQVRLGMFSDFDIGNPDDDMVGHFRGLIRLADLSFAPVTIGFARDAAASPVGGHVGWVMCGIETDAAAGPAGDPLDLPTLQFMSGNAAYDQGGDPTNDAERYDLLGSGSWDPVPAPFQVADYRIVLGAPAVPRLGPGESVTLRLALVAGADLNDLLLNAGEIVAVALGRDFDRDGDPANGAEFTVPWLPGDAGPVPAVTGRLAASGGAAAVDLDFDFVAVAGLRMAVVRRPGSGVPERRWTGLADVGRVSDTDQVGWPRTYELVAVGVGGGELVLDKVELPGPAAVAPTLSATPNPFNPQVQVSFTLAWAQPVDLVIHDLRGRVVRHLIAGEELSGTVERTWNGADDGGRPLPSGTYLARLVTPTGQDLRKLALVR